jgi:hypothetical protein
VLEEQVGGIVGCGTVAADAVVFAPQLLELGNAWTRENNLVVTGFHRRHQHQVIARQVSLNHRADVNNRRIAGRQSLSGNLAAA